MSDSPRNSRQSGEYDVDRPPAGDAVTREIATERAARERAAREDAERRRQLTPNVPVQTELGIPSNEVPDGPPGGAREGPGPARATPNTPLTSGINFKPTKGAL